MEVHGWPDFLFLPCDFAFHLEKGAPYAAAVSGLTTNGDRHYRRLLVDGTEPLGVHLVNSPLSSLPADDLLGRGQRVGGKVDLTIDGPSVAQKCRWSVRGSLLVLYRDQSMQHCRRPETPTCVPIRIYVSYVPDLEPPLITPEYIC
jgi:hypothetical protein